MKKLAILKKIAIRVKNIQLEFMVIGAFFNNKPTKLLKKYGISYLSHLYS